MIFITLIVHRRNNSKLFIHPSAILKLKQNFTNPENVLYKMATVKIIPLKRISRNKFEALSDPKKMHRQSK